MPHKERFSIFRLIILAHNFLVETQLFITLNNLVSSRSRQMRSNEPTVQYLLKDQATVVTKTELKRRAKIGLTFIMWPEIQVQMTANAVGYVK